MSLYGLLVIVGTMFQIICKRLFGCLCLDFGRSKGNISKLEKTLCYASFVFFLNLLLLLMRNG